MSSDKFRMSLIWWFAFVVQTIAAISETIERNFLKAAGYYCVALIFLLLASGIGTKRPFWRNLILYVLASACVGLLVYRIATGKFF